MEKQKWRNILVPAKLNEGGLILVFFCHRGGVEVATEEATTTMEQRNTFILFLVVVVVGPLRR